MLTERERVRLAIHEWRARELPRLIPRDLDLARMLGNDLVIDVVGCRRSGKTHLMYSAIAALGRSDNAIYLSFEDCRLWPVSAGMLDDVLGIVNEEGLLDRHGKVYLFLDEVQHVHGWERFARNVFDEMRGVVKLFVSGSSSRLGAREASPLLTGRHLTITVFPLSFREFLSFRGVEPSKAARSQAGRDRSSGLLREYLRTGGFPEVVLSDQKADLLSQYFVDVVRRDVVDRHGLRDSARSSSWPSPSRPTSAGVQLR